MEGAKYYLQDNQETTQVIGKEVGKHLWGGGLGW